MIIALWGIEDFLRQILCILKNLLYLAIGAGVAVVNLFLDAVGLLLIVIVAVMPDMPATPGIGATDGILGAINWVFPVADLITMFATALVIFATFMIIRIAARWTKAL